LVLSAVPNFTLIRESLGFWPRNPKNCQNCQLFRPAGANPLLDVGEIRRVYAGNRSTEVVNVWCDSVGKLGIYRQKLRWGISPKNFRSSSETTGPIEKKSRPGARMVRTSSIYFHAKFDGDLPLHGGVRKKT